MNSDDKKQRLGKLGIEERYHDYFSDAAASIVYHDFGNLILKPKRDKQLVYLLNEILNCLGVKPIDRACKFKIPIDYLDTYYNGSPAFDGKKFVVDHMNKLIEYGFDPNRHFKFDTRDEIDDYDYGCDVIESIANFYGYEFEQQQVSTERGGSWRECYVITDEYSPYTNYDGEV